MEKVSFGLTYLDPEVELGDVENGVNVVCLIGNLCIAFLI